MVITAARPAPTDPRTTRIPAGVAVLLGVLAVGAALAFGDLVAGLLSPASSPFLAVGAQFIRLTPEWLKEFATSTFGVYDKLVLLGGMAVAIALVAVATGLASRRRPGPGLSVVVVLGLAGLASTVAAPTFTAVDLAAPLAALVAGTGVFAGLHRLARGWARTRTSAVGVGDTGRDDDEAGGDGIEGDEDGDEDGDDTGGGGGAGPADARARALARRRLLLATGGAVVASGAAAGIGRHLVSANGVEASRAAAGALPPAAGAAPAPLNADFAALGTPTWLTSAEDFYRIDTALQVPQVRTSDYTLRIHGMVDRELTLSYDDLRRRRLIQAPITMTCVSNDIGGNLISNAIFTGVPLRDLLAEAGVRPGAEQIASTSTDGWTSGTPVDTVTDGRNAMLAIGMNGAALPVEHGFPVRMVVPGLYGFVSGCKWITDMELTTFDGGFVSYWQQRGWAQKAPIKTQSRIDVPRSGAVVPAGRVTVAGIAWAQHTGIDRVEVQSDDGPWIGAQLADEVSTDTWRMWRAVLDLPRGRHTLQVRATDRTGYTQTPKFTLTIPDGASGWHSIDVTAT